MNDQQPSVAIIDTLGKSERRQALADSFEKAGFIITTFYQYDFPNKSWKTEPREYYQKTLLIDKFSLILWHAGDYKLRENEPNIEGPRIFYGGFGEYDNRIPPDADRISHKLESKADVENAITVNNAKEILRYICDDGPTPSSLLPLTRPVAKTLLILCQGYLAAWAIEQTEISESDDRIKSQYSALHSMGWFNLKKSSLPHQLHGRYHSDKNGVQGAEWWKAALGDCELEKIIASELGGSTMNNLVPNPIVALSSQIDGNTTIRPKIVADAYNFLAKLI